MCVLICFHRTASFWLITRFTQTFLASAVKSRKKMRTSLMGRIVTFIIFSLTGSSRSRNTRQGHQLAMASAVPQPPPGLHETPKRSNIPVQHISTPYHPPPMSLHQAPGKPLSRYLKKFSCCSLIGRVCRRQLQRAGGGAGGTWNGAESPRPAVTLLRFLLGRRDREQKVGPPRGARLVRWLRTFRLAA